MPRTSTATEQAPAAGWMEALETFVLVLDARNPVWRKIIVRDRHTGQLAEVSLQGEEPPIDPGDDGRTFVVQKGKLYLQEVVRHKPQHFRPTTRTP